MHCTICCNLVCQLPITSKASGQALLPAHNTDARSSPLTASRHTPRRYTPKPQSSMALQTVSRQRRVKDIHNTQHACSKAGSADQQACIGLLPHMCWLPTPCARQQFSTSKAVKRHKEEVARQALLQPPSLHLLADSHTHKHTKPSTTMPVTSHCHACQHCPVPKTSLAWGPVTLLHQHRSALGTASLQAHHVQQPCSSKPGPKQVPWQDSPSPPPRARLLMRVPGHVRPWGSVPQHRSKKGAIQQMPCAYAQLPARCARRMHQGYAETLHQ